MLERVWRKGNSLTPLVGKISINQSSHWKTVWRFLKKLKTELLYDPAIPLLGTYLNKILIHKKNTLVGVEGGDFTRKGKLGMK